VHKSDSNVRPNCSNGLKLGCLEYLDNGVLVAARLWFVKKEAECLRE